MAAILPIKAVFFGKTHRTQKQRTSLLETDRQIHIGISLADMDDTLVLTSEADTKACTVVGRLAKQLLPQARPLISLPTAEAPQTEHSDSCSARKLALEEHKSLQVDLPKLMTEWKARFVAAPWDQTMQASCLPCPIPQDG